MTELEAWGKRAMAGGRPDRPERYRGGVTDPKIRPLHGARGGASAQEQSAKAQEGQARLAAEDIPQQTGGFIARDFAERVARGNIQQVDQVGVVFLLEMVHGAADEPVGVELASQCFQFAATAAAQDGLRDAARAAKTGDDAADGGDLHLRGCV